MGNWRSKRTLLQGVSPLRRRVQSLILRALSFRESTGYRSDRRRSSGSLVTRSRRRSFSHHQAVLGKGDGDDNGGARAGIFFNSYMIIFTLITHSCK